ncbi:TIGR04211 family SH3 domain-containing protein [Nitrincola tibetensis]|uniref:TIGR04211 family SH3 domain-containing protein n=1 Tax=Nitrincola tibetensis TaxID=2219697 RepID=A0A364NN49_9GAMM|nr:TIGR04211 family SH3 domain-containing protein [Nitrincola tibetensis]RAU18539.1 TIGR04211 family SH3 domain-containing protein [Nitrincola tibetensis]
MKKQFLLSVILSLSFAVPAYAQQRAHIADDVYVFTHGGPGNQYRINGRMTSGEGVTILNRNNNYVEVRNQAGRSGWVPEEFVAAGESVQARLPKLESELSESLNTIERQATEIETLNSRLQQLSGGNQDYAQQVEQLETQIRRLDTEIANMDQSNLIRWLTHGGLVALAGMILGLLVPYLPKRRKRQDNWF